MKPITRLTIISFLVSGLTFAALSAGMDYYDGMEFQIWRFIFRASVFGLFMALLFRYNFKKNEASKNK